MPEVQVAIGLRRKARDNLRDAARGQVILNNVAKEVAGCGGGGRLQGHEVGLLVQVFYAKFENRQIIFNDLPGDTSLTRASLLCLCRLVVLDACCQT